MISRLAHAARFGLFSVYILVAVVLAPVIGHAAPYAAMVMDARTGEVIHSTNADTRLHPASLTKMMTLYIAFQAIQRGEITLDTEVRITEAAASEPPSRLGLRAGQTIRLRYLIRGAAIRSANDAATAIGIAISGSEEAFARRMNATAQAMGMTNTSFRNMHGLTQEGHMSTARDMTVLGRHIIYDFPQYYNLFSRRSADAGIAQVNNTNRRFLDAYEGADGIKTGYTQAAGYNLVGSAQRGQVRIIATVFGGTSTADRNRRVAELLDMGFARASGQVRTNPPEPPAAATGAAGAGEPLLLSANTINPGAAARTIRVSGQVTRSLRPEARPGSTQPASTGTVVVAAETQEAIADTLASLLDQPAAGAAPSAAAASVEAATQQILSAAQDDLSSAVIDPPDLTPEARPREIIMTAAAIAPAEEPIVTAEAEVVTRLSTSGGRHWGINVGRFNSHSEAERWLIQVALNESVALEGGLRRVVQRSGGYDANFMGLSRDAADLACRRLQARGVTCFMIGTE